MSATAGTSLASMLEVIRPKHSVGDPRCQHDAGGQLSAGGGLRLGLDQVELRPGAVRARPTIEGRILGGVLLVGTSGAHVDATTLLTLLGDSHLGSLRLRIGPVDDRGGGGTFASSADVGRPCGRLSGPLSTIASVSTPIPTKDPRIVALPAAEIRRRFVEFFAERGHTVVPR